MLGFVATRHAEKTRGWELLTEADKKALIDHTLLQRTGTVDDVVKAVLFILKDALLYDRRRAATGWGVCAGRRKGTRYAVRCGLGAFEYRFKDHSIL